MKKFHITAIAVISFITLTNAQNVKFGITAGYLGAIETEEVGSTSIRDYGSGAYIGVLADFKISDRFHIQSEALFGHSEETFINLPVLAKYYITKKIHVLAGPQLTYSVNDLSTSRLISSAEDETFRGDFDRFGLDLSFGGGYDITKRLFIEARYSFQITDRDLNRAMPFGEVKLGEIEFNTFHIGVGYKF